MSQIKLSVDFYNEQEKQLFGSYPNSSQINSLVENPVNIQKNEFLSYMMFTEQRNAEGFQTYGELNNRITKRLGDIEDYLSFNNNSVQAKFIGNNMDLNLTERIGVGLGLCTINKLHGLNESDWQRIPTISGRNGLPTLDFELPIASTGSNFIQIENKGTTQENNNNKTSSVSNHYASIKSKKESVRNTIAPQNNLCYGTIGVLDNQSNSLAKIWLVDPPSKYLDIEPAKYKLLARLSFYLEEFQNIGVNKKLIKILENRINEIIEETNYQKLDNKPLDYYYNYPRFILMENKSFVIVDHNEALGRVFFIKQKGELYPFIYALPKAIFKLILKQDFEKILDYKYNPDFINDSLNISMRLSQKDFENYEIPKNVKFVQNESKKIYEATYFGKISHSESGRIFGLLSND
jgi:hypothetical protein